MPATCQATGLSFPAASSAMKVLVEMGVARELTGTHRNRLFVYDGHPRFLEAGAKRA